MQSAKDFVCIVENTTHKKISKKNIEMIVRETASVARKNLKGRGAQEFLYIYVIGEAAMAALNKKFRGIGKPTDVLSFEKGNKRGNIPVFGEIALCPGVIEKQAKNKRAAFRDEWAHALAHGTLHILGHHHEESAEKERELQKKENIICKTLGYAMPHPEFLNSKFKITSSK